MTPFLTCSTRESERRLDLIMEKREVVDELQQLGHLLQEERDLSEQLSGHASMKRYHAVICAYRDRNRQQKSKSVSLCIYFSAIKETMFKRGLNSSQARREPLLLKF